MEAKTYLTVEKPGERRTSAEKGDVVVVECYNCGYRRSRVHGFPNEYRCLNCGSETMYPYDR